MSHECHVTGSANLNHHDLGANGSLNCGDHVNNSTFHVDVNGHHDMNSHQSDVTIGGGYTHGGLGISGGYTLGHHGGFNIGIQET